MVLTPFSGRDTVSAGDTASFLATTTRGKQLVVFANDMAAFFNLHNDQLFICYDVAELHRHLLRCCQLTGICIPRSWWGRAREHRLFDVMLMDQRLRMIRDGVIPLPKPLDALSAAYCSAFESGPCQTTARILLVFCGMVNEIYRLAATRAELSKSICDYGFQHDVCGALGMAAASPALLELSPNAQAMLRRDAEARYHHASTVLRRDNRVSRCFHWDAEGVHRDAKGFPQCRENVLRDWLRRRADETCRDLRGAPITIPLDDHGRVSLVPDHWGVLADADPLLRAWKDLSFSSMLLRGLNGSWSKDTYAQVIPHLTLQPLSRVHSCRTNICRHRHRQDLTILELHDLELRCFAVTAQKKHFRLGFRLAEMLSHEEDPIEYTRLCLTGKVDGQLAVQSSWFHLLAPDSQTTVVRLMLMAVPRGLNDRQIVQLVLNQYQGTNVGITDIDRLRRKIMSDIITDLDLFLEDPTPDTLARTIACDRQALWEDVKTIDDCQTLPFALRNAVTGKGNEQRWNRLVNLCQDARLGRQMRTCGPGTEMLEALTQVHPVSAAGSVGSKVLCTEVYAAEYLQLVDDVRKQLLFDLAANGIEVIAIDGDEVALAASVATPRHAVLELASASLQNLLGDVARGCCTSRTVSVW